MTDPVVLVSELELEVVLDELPEWTIDGTHLTRSFTFADFGEAFGFMTRVAMVAERLNHHPDWSNSWNRVDIQISNHQLGGVSNLCIQLARSISAIEPN